MFHTDKKILPAIEPGAAVNNASFTAIEIDTQGFRYAEIVLMLGATDIALSALKVQETDTTGAGYADVPGLAYGTDANDTGVASALPAATDDNKIFKFEIDLRGRKRFLKLVATVGAGATGAFAAAWAELSRGEQSPFTAAKKGVAQNLRI